MNTAEHRLRQHLRVTFCVWFVYPGPNLTGWTVNFGLRTRFWDEKIHFFVLLKRIYLGG
jgi:hypothetical protein